jgi:hypothetical protein
MFNGLPVRTRIIKGHKTNNEIKFCYQNSKIMKTLITTLALLILLNPATRAQGSLEIRGQVSNGLNHMAIKNCHIYLDGRVAGTISNEYGEFTIEIPQKYQDRHLNISHVGFETTRIAVSEIDDNFLEVTLIESPILLAEVVISPEKEDIVDTAITSVKNEFQDEEDMITVFYEVLLKRDKNQQILRTVLAKNNPN